MKTLITILAITLITVANVFSQNTDNILLYNGKIIEGKIKRVSESKIKFTKNTKCLFRNRTIHKVNIFSFNRDSNTVYLYQQDSSIGDIYNIAQMQHYLNGYANAKENYHAPLATIGGLASGLTGGMLGFWGTIVPTAFVFTAGAKTPSYDYSITPDLNVEELYAGASKATYGQEAHVIPNVNLTDEIQYFPQYKEGYEAAAKDKKIKNTMKGTIIGFIGMVVTTSIIRKL